MSLHLSQADDLVAIELQIYLLQYPLRPPWRPYDLDHSKTVPCCAVPARQVLETASVADMQMSPGYAGQVQAWCKAC